MLLRLFFLAGLLSELLTISHLSAAASPGADAQWLKLMHYRQGWLTASESSIENPEYFFHPNGRRDPSSEWQASLKALLSETILYRGAAVDPRCQFPARALYFQRLGLIPAAQRPCPDYEVFRARLKIESMSLVFSTAFAGNSASMFGHTLLKLNRSDSASGRGLLDYGVAFLALSNPADGALYTVKGMFGGYPGFYNIQSYYELVNQYAYNENRDLWEVKVALDSDERAMLEAHLWELSHGLSTSYYFAHVNCAAMLAELIDVVKPQWDIRASMHGFVMPTELMRRVADRLDDKARGESAGNTSFRPSQKRRWLARWDGLDGLQRRVATSAWNNRSVADVLADAAILDLLLDQTTLAKSTVSFEEQKDVRAFEKEVLRARSELPPLPEPVVTATNNPLLGHAPSLARLSAGGMKGIGRYGLRLKAGWHDLLSDPLGFEPAYHLNFLDLSAYQMADSNRFSELNFKIAEVWSLNPWKSDDHQLSWTMEGGADYFGEQRYAYFRASYGVTTGFDHYLFSILPGAVLRQNFTRSRWEAKGLVRVQALARWTPHIRTLAFIEPHRESLGVNRFDWSLETRGDIAKDYEIGIKWDRLEEISEETRWELGVSRSF